MRVDRYPLKPRRPLVPLPFPAPQGTKWQRDAQGMPRLRMKTPKEMLRRRPKP